MNINDITFSKIYKNPNGSAKVFMNVEGEEVLVMTPKLNNSFGANDYQGNNRFSLTLKLTEELEKNLKKIDKKVLETVRENKELYSQLGLKKQPKLESLEMLYKPIVKESEEYGSSVSVKLPTVYEKESFQTDFYNSNKQMIEADIHTIKQTITFKTKTRTIIHFAGVWFVNGKFGVNVNAKQVLIFPDEAPTGYAFLDSEDEEIDTESVKQLSVV